MIPYARHSITDADKAAVMAVLESDRLTQGPTVAKLEAKLCEVSGAEYAVAVNSGTAALHLAYLACGMGHWVGRETLQTTPLSFVATANAALQCGAEVDFVDLAPCGEVRGNEAMCIRPGPVATVSLGGDPWLGTMADPTNHIADHSHGPLTLGAAIAATFSFHPCKHVAAGEGGAIVTDMETIAARCRMGRDHGKGGPRPVRASYALGYNYRLPEMSAALALSQLGRYQRNVQQRRFIASRYDAAFKGKVRTVPHTSQSARHLYQLLVEDRDDVMGSLRLRGVGTQIHYEPIIPLQPYYRERFGYTDDIAKERWPNALWHSEHTLSIPLFPTLTEQEIETVITSVLEVCG